MDGSSERTLRPGNYHLQVGLGGADDGVQLALIFALHVLNGQHCRSFLVNHSAETSLALDNDIGDAHLSAEGRKVDHQLNWVDIVRNNNQGSLLGLNEGDTVIEAVLDKKRLFRFLMLRVSQA